jgi:hypothetical protein
MGQFYNMKKTVVLLVLLIAFGNTLIMLLENAWISKSSLQELQKNLFFGNANQDVTTFYPAQLLLKKTGIWLISFASLSAVLYYIRAERKKLIRNLLIGFYGAGCLANVFIVPHPAWFMLFTLALVPVSFIMVENGLNGLHQISWQIKNSQPTAGSANMETNPA